MAWYNTIGKEADTVISSRVRLARNLVGYPFASKLDAAGANEIIEKVSAPLEAAGFRKINFSDISPVMATSYVERHYVSPEFAQKETPHALLLQENGGMAVMVCEEDHLRIQSILPGLALDEAYRNASRIEKRLDEEFDFAYSEKLGYLTHCPTNLGTGMRESCMLFLPALKRAGAIEDTLKTFKSEFGLTIRGVYGEGSDAAYDMYQISNSRTLGVSEGEIISHVEQAVARMCYCERVALEKLVKEKQTELLDGISRSYAVLKGAYALTAQELMKLLVDVKIGVILGILPIKSTAITDEMIWACSASSLQIITNGSSEEERDKARARIVRKLLTEEE